MKGYGTRVETWPAVYARHQPRGEKKDQPEPGAAAGRGTDVPQSASKWASTCEWTEFLCYWVVVVVVLFWKGLERDRHHKY